MLGGHKDLYSFGRNVPTSSLLLLVLTALVCSRGYKRAREGEVSKSLVKKIEWSRVLLSSFSCVLPPLLGRPASPFIGEGEDTCYREGKREKRRKVREKKASRVAASFISFM